MQLNRTGTPFTREERNKQNENWATIENEFNNVVDTVTEKAFNQVVDAAKLDWGEPVATMSDLPTEAIEGDTRMARDTGLVFRFDGTEWKEIQQIDVGPVNEVDTRLSKQLADLGINLRTLGAALDGVTDDYQIVMDALATYKNIVVPGDAIIGTSETIIIGQGQSLIGLTENTRGYGNTAQIKYIGEESRHKAVVRLGKNDVDAEPEYDGTDIQFQNIIVDANNLAGFGVYGTYLTNETAVNNIYAKNALEYGQYFARAWYAKFTNLLATHCKGQGIAFGMPLEYEDGTTITWVTPSPLEVNNCDIDNIRAHSNGKYFSDDNPNTFDPTNVNMRRKGYGIGFGVGNSFNAEKFTSEKNGGVGIYVYTEVQPMKNIKTGYLEQNCLNSGLDPASTMPNMIIEHTNNLGGNYVIEDVFMNHNSGGIMYVGSAEARKVWLKNCHQPRFLSSADGLTLFELYSVVLKDNVHYEAGYYNTLEEISAGVNVIQTVDTRGSFTIPVSEYKGYKLIFVKGDGTTPFGSFILNYANGTSASRSFPAGLGTSYVLTTVGTTELVSITKGGATGATSSNVTFKVVNTPLTYI